jgi:hypothetical protein
MRFVFSAEATPDAEIVEVRRLATVDLSLGDTNHGVVCGHASQSEPRMRREKIDRGVCAQSGSLRIFRKKIGAKAIGAGQAF